MSDIKSKYVLLEHKEDPELVGITLTDEKYKGIIYSYGKVNFNADDIKEEKETAELNFKYTILHNEHDYDVEGDPELKQLMGQILVSMIKETMSSEQSGNDNSERVNH